VWSWAAGAVARGRHDRANKPDAALEPQVAVHPDVALRDFPAQIHDTIHLLDEAIAPHNLAMALEAAAGQSLLPYHYLAGNGRRWSRIVPVRRT